MGLYNESTSIKANDEELGAWRDAAARQGMPLITWIRLVLDHAAGVGELHAQLERAAAAYPDEHAAMMRAARAAKLAERKAAVEEGEKPRRRRGKKKLDS